jgi:hypothetical protein
MCVLSYPKGDVVASIHITGHLYGVCSDNAGNVFATTNDGKVLEFQHGGTTSIATLSLPGTTAVACAVDPLTNTLAVVFLSTDYNIALFSNESGSPSLYSSKIDSYACGYDNAGNLFVSGQVAGTIMMSELASGQFTFVPLSINGKLGLPGQVQWDGSHITYESRAGAPPSISRLTVSGSIATVVGTTYLKSKTVRTSLSWIYNGKVLMPYSTKQVRIKRIGVWKYPQGGKRNNSIKFEKSGFWVFQGVTVSVASSR